VSWELAGRGLGTTAREWACLVGPYARPANEVLFERLQVGEAFDSLCDPQVGVRITSEFGWATAAKQSARVVTTVRA
jgi:hypothetical protein